MFKKVEMQVVKFSLIVLLSFFQLNKIYCQVIFGKYELEKKPSSVYSNYTFFKNNTFISTSTYVFGHGGHFSQGYYLIKNDSLILFYDSISSPQVSSFKITSQIDSFPLMLGQRLKRPIEFDKAIINLITEDVNGDKIPYIVIKTMKDENILAVHFSDSLGYSTIYTTGKIANRLLIIHIGYQNIEIKLENFWGYLSDIRVQLGDFTYDTYNKKYRITKYLIKVNETSKLVLEDVKGNKLTFNKQ